MKLRGYRRRLWVQRGAFIIVSALIGVVIAQLTNSAEAQRDISQTRNVSVSSSATKVSETEDWLSVLQSLDNQRALAIVQRDISALTRVYKDISSTYLADVKLIEELISLDAVVKRLYFEVLNVQEISHRWSANEEVVELSVSDQRSAYFIESDDKDTRVAQSDIKTWLVSLSKKAGKWLIADVQASNDS